MVGLQQGGHAWTLADLEDAFRAISDRSLYCGGPWKIQSLKCSELRVIGLESDQVHLIAFTEGLVRWVAIDRARTNVDYLYIR